MPQPILRSPVLSTDTSKPIRSRSALFGHNVSGEPYFANDNNGVLVRAPLFMPWSYPGGSYAGRPAPGAPADGAIVRNVARAVGRIVQADCIVRNGGGIGFDKGALTLQGATGRGRYLEIPAAMNADIWANKHPVNGAYFLEVAWFIWPDTSTWTGHSTGVHAPIINTCGTDAAPTAYYATTPERVFAGIKVDGTVQASFQTALNVTTDLQIGSVNANLHRGKATRLSLCRYSGGLFIEMRSSGGKTTTTAALNAVNTVDYSASKTKVGVTTTSQWEANGMNLSGAPFKLIDYWCENLYRSGRDPIAVLESEYQVAQMMIAASAAKNGGNSQIYV